VPFFYVWQLAGETPSAKMADSHAHLYPDPHPPEDVVTAAELPQAVVSPSQANEQHDDLHYDGLPSLPATTVAHHGLQALEAATAQQYAQSATMHVAETSQFAPVAPAPNTHQQQDQPSPPSQQQQHHQVDGAAAAAAAAAAAVAAATAAVPMTASSSATPSAAAAQKVTRLRRACDMCSQRKVKVGLHLDTPRHCLALATCPYIPPPSIS
jgi:hypothetical protein